MQIQKHLFKISEKALKNQHSMFWWKILQFIFMTLAVVCTLLLLLGHIYILPNNYSIAKCLQNTNININAQNLYYVTDIALTVNQTKYYKQHNKIINLNNECMMIQNRNYSQSDQRILMFGYDYISMFMDDDKRNQMKYTNFTIYIRPIKSYIKFIYGLDNLLINQLVRNQHGLFLDQKMFIISHTAYVFTQFQPLFISQKIYALFRVIFIYLIVSIITTLYIYGTIVAAPTLIILILQACNTLRNNNINQIFRMFPWVGTHLIIRDTSTTLSIKKQTYDICLGFFYYFIFLYFLYSAGIILMDRQLFQTREFGLQELLFGFMAFIQFAAIIFMRTRSFIRHYPTCHTLIFITFLFYTQIVNFGFKRLACYSALSISGALFCWMVINYQILAATIFDPTNNDIPRQDRPRIAYNPLFNMNWRKNLPEEWSMLMPLFGRQHFSSREMSLVDRNSGQLNFALGNI